MPGLDRYSARRMPRDRSPAASASSVCLCPCRCLRPPKSTRAGDGARTRDPQLGKLMLYQLSYSRTSTILLPCGQRGFGSLGPGPRLVPRARTALRQEQTRRPRARWAERLSYSRTLHYPVVAGSFPAESHRSDLNRGPLDYESSALPLSYGGVRHRHPARQHSPAAPTQPSRRPAWVSLARPGRRPALAPTGVGLTREGRAAARAASSRRPTPPRAQRPSPATGETGVELRGFEPLASAVRLQRSPN